MGNFTININTKVSNNYVPTQTIFLSEENCAAITQSLPFGVQENTQNDALLYILQAYTKITPWKTIKIKNLVYSNSTNFYLEHSGAQIPEAGSIVYDIDITGVAKSTAISDFIVKFDNLTLTQNETITFELAIEDTDLFIGTYATVTIFLQKVECTPTEPVLNYYLTDFVNNTCYTEVFIYIVVPEEGRRVNISFTGITGFQEIDNVATPVDEFLTYADQLVTPHVFNLKITADSNSGAGFASGILVQIFADETTTTILDSYLLTRQHNLILC